MNIIPITDAKAKKTDNIRFTKDQQKAYNALIEFIDSDFNEKDFKRALIGPAGTGKTFLVKSLIMNCSLSHSLIGLAAPTHKAARVLKESIGIPGIVPNTVQSDLGLRLNFNVETFDPDNPPFDPKGEIKINNYKLYIVDESSMIYRKLLTLLERTCKTHKCKILYIGDSSQLPPINEKYSGAFKGVKSYTLKEIVRQGENNPISPLLELLRNDIKNKTYTFLNYIQRNREHFNEDYTKGYLVCNSEQFTDLVYSNFNDEELTRNVDYAKVIAYTNPCVSFWNKQVRNTIIADADKSVITKNDLFISYVTIVNQFNSAVIHNSEEYIIKDVVNFVHPKYELKGFMVKFQAIHGGEVTTPLFIVDHTDRFSIMKYVQILQNLLYEAKNARASIRAQRWRDYYEFAESCLILIDIVGNINNIKIAKRSIDYGFALTAHKSQGSTFNTVLVDVNDIVYNRLGHPYTDVEDVNRRLYVACSRAKDKLYLKFGK